MGRGGLEGWICARGCFMSTFSPLCGEKSPERSEGDEGWLIAGEMPRLIQWPQAPARLEGTDRSGEAPPLRPAAARKRGFAAMCTGGWRASLAALSATVGRPTGERQPVLRTNTTAEVVASPHKRARPLKRPE